MSALPLARLSAIRKSFGSTEVLKGVDLDILSGEVHVLAGGNGAGKSTLINVLCGAITDYTGDIFLGDQKLTFSSPSDAIRSGIAVIHQELALVPAMSVLENLYLGDMPTRYGFVNQSLVRDHARAALEKVGLNVDIETPVEQLPISSQQLLEIAKALKHDARVVVMDEPTSALNAQESDRLFALIEELKSRGCGVLYVSHRMEEFQRIATRISVLRDGMVVCTDSAENLPPDRIAALMVGESITTQSDDAHEAQVGETVLQAEGITVLKPNGFTVVDNASISVRAGEVVGLAGLEGSGNSELLWAIFGAGAKESGTVSVRGEACNPRNPRAGMRSGMGLVTNDRKTNGLVLSSSVTDNASLATLPEYTTSGLINFRRLRQEISDLCASFSVKAESGDVPVGSLSGGNQQKVVLAKWHQTHPCVLLLDEPTRGIDVNAKSEIYRQIREWKQAGMAILLISSDIHELLLLSDRIAVMRQGRVEREFSRAEATPELVIQAAIHS